MVQTPALGAWSDIHGRKPLLILSQGLSCVPFIIILLNLNMGVPLSWVYIVQAFTGSATIVTPSLAYVADVMPPQHRATCFGLIMASFSVAILIGPPLGVLLKPATAPLVTMGVVGMCMLCTAFLLPESLPPEAAATAKQRQSTVPVVNGPGAVLSSTWRALAILKRSPLFMRLALLLMLASVVSEGIQDIIIQYLQLKLGFGMIDVVSPFRVVYLFGLDNSFIFFLLVSFI